MRGIWFQLQAHPRDGPRKCSAMQQSASLCHPHVASSPTRPFAVSVVRVMQRPGSPVAYLPSPFAQGVPCRKSTPVMPGVFVRTILPAAQMSHGGEQPSTSQQSQPLTLGAKRVVQIDDEDEDSPSTPAKSQRRLEEVLLSYPRDQPNSIPISYADVEYLRPSVMLNDSIIDFYLKYIHLTLVPPERRSSIFIFSSFFYTRLTQLPAEGLSAVRDIAARAKWVHFSFFFF
ncbi:unnamed protein product [Gongylonema pulchrum]|uniref:ULP_PROTEASE domain-containing protein n=1 Tax=Gongylonema pulchrum TaxID=637853 RepID=A0A183ENT4_9BILA|nr:unnamed protein product [Gongylonema pulchrum]